MLQNQSHRTDEARLFFIFWSRTLTIVDTGEDFLSVHCDIFWCINTNTNLISLNA